MSQSLGQRLPRLTLTAFLAACVMLVAFAAPAQAATTATESEQPVYQLNQQQLTDLNALASGTSEVGARVFNADLARSEGASEESILDYGRVLESAGWTVQGEVDLARASSGSFAGVNALRACAGASGYTGLFFPLGYQFALNSCQTAQFIALLGAVVAGGGIGALAGFLTVIGVPVGVVSTVIAALAGAGVAFATICQAYSSNGAIYVNSGLPPAFPPSCWGQ